MGPVGPPSHLGCPVDLNVIDDQVISIQTFVFGIGLGILQQMEKKFGGLGGPATLGSAMNLGLGVATNSSHVAGERDDFLLGHHVFQVGGGSVKRHFLDGLSGLTSVLKRPRMNITGGLRLDL